MCPSNKRFSFPIVRCPGCKTAMDMMVVESGPNGLHTATYRCERCGTETKRSFKHDSDD